MTDRIGKPGTPEGPCDPHDCPHIGCADLRLLAETLCGLCEREIGYETDYEDATSYGLIHTSCRDDRIAALCSEPALVS